MSSVLTEAVGRGGDAVVAALSARLSDVQCTLVERGYPNELILGFGKLREGPRGLPVADWMLYTRATPWDLETPAGLAAASRPSLSDRKLRTVRRHLLDRRLRALELRLSPAAVTLSFESAAFLLKPQRLTQGVAWVMTTPEGQIVRAWQHGCDVVSGDEPFDGEEPDRDVAARPVVATANVDALTTYLVTWAGMRKVLWSAADELGWTAYEPRLGQGPDAILITPHAGLVVVEVKRGRHEPSAVLHLERFISERVWAENTRRALARRPNATADVPVVSKQQLTQALTRFAAAA